MIQEIIEKNKTLSEESWNQFYARILRQTRERLPNSEVFKLLEGEHLLLKTMYQEGYIACATEKHIKEVKSVLDGLEKQEAK